MRGPGRLAAAFAALALLLPLAGCGKYGKPVRKSRTALAAGPGVQRSAASYGSPRAALSSVRDAQEKKPGDR